MTLRKKLEDVLEGTQDLTSTEWEVADTCFRLIDRVRWLETHRKKSHGESDDIEDILEYALRPYQVLLRTFNLNCKKCGGKGSYMYGSTSTWRGGMGGAAMTSGVCDSCWGTGRSDKQGVNLKNLSS